MFDNGQEDYEVNVFWKVCYYDSSSKRFAQKMLFVDTDKLAPVEKHAIEMIVERQDMATARDMLGFRQLFSEMEKTGSKRSSMRGFSMLSYFEDEQGIEIPLAKVGPMMTGNPDAVLAPILFDDADVKLMLSGSVDFDYSVISLSSEELRVLSYYLRDVEELRQTEFYNDGPGTLSFGNPCEIKTGVSMDEIRSCVQVFRRLYMQKEPANLCKAAEIFVKALKLHPLANWVESKVSEYSSDLQAPPSEPMLQLTLDFTTKRLIDVYLYTLFVHQPDSKRERQFKSCLKSVNDDEHLLLWLFLNALQECICTYVNIELYLRIWFDGYVLYKSESVDIVESLRRSHPGVGLIEKKDERLKRIFDETIGKIAESLWIEEGRPVCGPGAYVKRARARFAELGLSH